MEKQGETQMEPEFSKPLQSQAFEILCSNDIKPMETLFSLLCSPQQSQRSQAQKFLDCSKKHYPDLLFIKLVYLIRCSTHVETRSTAVRVLRLVQVRDLWPKLSEMAQVNLKSHFLVYLKEEDSMLVLRLFSVVLAEMLSLIYKTGNQWPELLDFLVESVRKNDNKFQETALLVLACLSKDSRWSVCLGLKDSLLGLHLALLKALASPNHDVQVASFGAVVSLISLFSDSSSDCNWFHNLLRAMMVGVFNLLNSSQDNYAQRAFKEFMTLVLEESQLVKPYLIDIVQDMLQIAESQRSSEEIKCFAIRLVISMAQMKDLAPLMLDLPYPIMVRLFSVPMEMLLCIEEEKPCNGVGGGESDNGEGDNAGKANIYNFAIMCLNQLTMTLGAQKIVPIAFELLSLYLDAQEWQKRHAGIALLAVIAKDCSDEMILMGDFLGEVVTNILKLFQDSNVQVRRAAFSFMQMPTNFVQVIQILYHPRIVPALAAVLDKDQNNRVKEQAASAMLFFLKNTLPESLTLYIDVEPIMKKLLALLQEAIRGIRVCAEFGTAEFKPFVKRILSELSLVIRYPNRSYSENVKAYDIAVSALGRICEFHRDSIDATTVVF
ncbi:importin-5-like [Quillaja saponaria]|uniref:Importin-5-like n=1 Tax=Quillaja saponaria TaxID=32244 RepID=A0AAD7PLZ3_QUISA|nr:importin-5-like [Quillaja saponaria]